MTRGSPDLTWVWMANIFAVSDFFRPRSRHCDAETDPAESHPPRGPDHGDPPPAATRVGGGDPHRATRRADTVGRPQAARHHDRPASARARVRRPAVRLFSCRQARSGEPFSAATTRAHLLRRLARVGRRCAARYGRRAADRRRIHATERAHQTRAGASRQQVTPQVLDLVIKATVLLAAAGMADALLQRRGSAAARHLVWSVAIAALLVLPVASYALPRWTVRIPVARAAVTAPTASDISPVSAGVSPPVSAPACSDPGLNRCATVPDGSRPAASDASGLAPLTLLAALAAVYAVGLMVLLAELIIEPFALRRLTRASSEMKDGTWRRRLDEAAGESGVTRPVRLLQSAGEVMPLTFGTLAPTIVVPASADQWSDDRRRAVLLHELAHIARRDCLIQR